MADVILNKLNKIYLPWGSLLTFVIYSDNNMSYIAFQVVAYSW